MKRLLLLSVFWNIVGYHQTFSQSLDSIRNIVSALDDLSVPTQDQLYIQTSKDIYELEEDLWFKIYALDAQSLQYSDRDKMVRMFLVSPDSLKTLWEDIYHLENGFAQGHIYLENTLPEGDYIMVATSASSIAPTRTSRLMTRKIRLVKNIAENQQDSISNVGSQINFHLFPEGGHLVDGISSKLAFLCTNEFGLPIDLEGILYRSGVPIDTFKNDHAGMGSFVLQPKISHKYSIKLNVGAADSTYTLPEIQPQGVVMEVVKHSSDTLEIQVTRSDSHLGKDLFLRAQVRGITYSIAIVAKSKISRIIMPLRDFPQGISEITVFDGSQPILERLIFVDKQEKIHYEVSFENQTTPISLLTRQKVNLKLEAKTEEGQPVMGHFGISIFESLFESNDHRTDIVSYNYLSSQIVGQIYNPGYYFDEAMGSKRLLHLDLLLLTQGWRKYIWNARNISPNAKGHTTSIDGVEGSIRPKNRRASRANSLPVILAYTPDGSSQIVNVDSFGNFILSPDQLIKSKGGQLYLRYFPQNYQQYDLKVYDNLSTNMDTILRQIDVTRLIPLSRNSFDDKALSFYKDPTVVQLDEVVVTAKRKMGVRDKYMGRLDSIARLELTTDYVCKYNILNCPIHTVDKENKKPEEGEIYYELLVWSEVEKAYVSGTDKSNGFINPPLPPYHYPKLTDQDLLTLFHIVRTNGFHAEMEFYQPDHELYDDPSPDYRNTLLWKPDVKTDQNGEVTISFFCSDIHSKFKIRIEGVGPDGRLGYFSNYLHVFKY